jgi:MFS transporter, OFA family, oxalate/formate antiporter
MATVPASYQEITNPTGRVFRVGESPKSLLGYNRWVVIMAAWLSMGLAGLLEYTWGALSGSLQAAHHWGNAPTFWLFSFFVVFESLVQIGTGYLRNRGILSVRWATIIGGIVCGVVGYSILATSTNIWTAYLGYAVLGGIGSGMVYSSCINIVAKWFPDRKGFLTGFVNGGWAYGSVPFIAVIGGFSTAGGVLSTMSPHAVKVFILWQGLIMTVGIGSAGILLKDPPKNWWPRETDPLTYAKTGGPDVRNNPPAPIHLNVRQMWRTRQAKWIGIQYALFIGCSLFGVAYYFPFAVAMHLSSVAAVAGAAGFALTDGCARPIYGFISRYTGRRRVMIYGYTGNVIFQMLAYWAGAAHNASLFAVFAVISGALSGVNFPMTAALVADYYGENNNAVNYGSIYAFKALGGSFAGGLAALIMTGTLWGSSHYHWLAGFIFGASLGFLAMLTMVFLVRRPTLEELQAAVRAAPDKVLSTKPAVV